MTDKVNIPKSNSDKLTEEKFLEELSFPKSLDELRIILSKISLEKPISETLFKEKYQIFILENFLPWQKPLGELYNKTIAICLVKPRKWSEENSNRNEVFLEDDGCPLPILFEKLSQSTSNKSRTHSLIRALNIKYYLLPLSLSIGKKILSMCNKIEIEHFQKLPVVTICHGNPTKSAVLLGSFPHNNSSLIITNQGSVKKEEQLLRLTALKESHLQGFPPTFSNITTSVFARYDFLECDTSKKSALNPIKDNNVFMECWWSDASALLEPLTASCSCFAKIEAVGGNNLTGACTLFNELQIIESLQNGLQTGVMTFSESKADGDIMKSLKGFINEQKTALSKREKQKGAMGTAVEDFDNIILQARENLDFTEKLWLILKDISSCEELQEALTFVYKALEEFPSPPYVFQKNMSNIALSIKRMMEKSIVCPDMTPKYAIQLLVEIGMEKLRRDYVTLFLRLELIPFESISYFLQPELASSKAITCLKKLHTVLELTIICKKRLFLTDTLLREFVRSTLKHYTCVPDVDLSHVFTFEIPAVKARQLLNPMRPTIWEISFVSTVDGYMKQSIHRYVTTPIHDHIYAPDNYHPKLMLKTASYVYLTAILVQDNARI